MIAIDISIQVAGTEAVVVGDVNLIDHQQTLLAIK